MAQPMKFDFVSDVSCPWCVIGLRGLELALEQVGDLVEPELTFHPFELNPNMPAGGQNIVEHVGEKYGATPEQSRATRDMIRARAAEVGFTMAGSDQSRIYNTFDAHRLLHWARLQGRQVALKHALFEAYFTEQHSPADHNVLVAAAAKAGLDTDAARRVLESGDYAAEVREAEQLWVGRGVTAVPAVIVNARYIISGGQPPAAFEQAIRQIAAEVEAQAPVQA
jgi:predicted DsbA family dithiol-disulfide isomerase